MRYRIEFCRKQTASRAGQPARQFAIEVAARNEAEAVELARNQSRREGRGDNLFDILKARKI